MWEKWWKFPITLPSVAWDTNQWISENASSKTQAIFFPKVWFNYLHDRIFLAGYPHWAHIDFWMWYDERPQRRHNVCVLLWRLPKLEVPFVYKLKKKMKYVLDWILSVKVRVNECVDNPLHRTHVFEFCLSFGWTTPQTHLYEYWLQIFQNSHRSNDLTI